MIDQFAETPESRKRQYATQALTKLYRVRLNKQLIPTFTEGELSLLVCELFDRIEGLENELNEKKSRIAYMESLK